MVIPDPNFSHPGSRIREKEFKYFNPKKFSKLSEIWSGLFVPDPVFLPSRIPVLRIRIHRIHVFLGLLDPDPDPLVTGMDPDPDPALDPDPSIIMQK